MADLKQNRDPKDIKNEFKARRLESSSSLDQIIRRHKHDGIESEKMNDGIERVVASFETGEQYDLDLYVPFDIIITKVRGRTIKAIAASDNGTIIFKDHNSNTMATLTVTASTVIDTDLTAQNVDSNNKIPKDKFYSLVSAKSTAGGKVMVSIEYERL